MEDNCEAGMKLFFDNNIIDYLYQILEKGIEIAASTVDINERKAILSIWDNCTIVTTSGLYQEVEQRAESVSSEVKQKIKSKILLLDGRPIISSTALNYGEGLYGEGRYGMPDFYHTILNLFKEPNSPDAKRDAQHIVNCYDNKIKYLITLDRELREEVGKSPKVKEVGVGIMKPQEFTAKFL